MGNVGQIAQYVNIGLIILFVLIVIGFALALFRGFMRGVWKSTHNMIFMLTLIVIAFLTLDALTDFIGSFPINNFIKGSFYISKQANGETTTYYVPITTVKETLTEFVKGFYTLYNVSASSASATNFALALASSLLKVVVFIVDMILIMTLGNLFSFLSWYLIFRHFIPKVARKTVKIRWLGLIETGVTFLAVTVLFMTPFTALTNSLNQSYQKNRPTANSELVENIGTFVDAYNSSLFAQVFFNWTVDKSGMTFDTRLFDSLTKGNSGEYSVGVVGELANLTNMVATASTAVTSEGSQIAFDATSLISREIIDQALDTIANSGLITSILPLVTEIAFNSDLLADFIPNRLVDLSDVVWAEELGYVRDMVDCVFESGVIDNLYTIDPVTEKRTMRNLQGEDLCNFIESIVYAENFDTLLDVFRKIDDSKVLSRAIPALLQFVINNDEKGTTKQYLPLTWEELNELSWGYETYALLDFLHATAELDTDFIKAIFMQTGMYPADSTVKTLSQLISEHAQAFKQLVVGKVTSSGEVLNTNKYGQTIVFDSQGNRYQDNGVARHYCLFDMNLVDKVYPHILDNLFDLEGFSSIRANLTDDDLILFHQAVADLNNGVRIKNYKVEFDAVLDVVATLAADTELLDALFSGKGLDPLMEEAGNFFSINTTHVGVFKTAIAKMDNSTLLYSALAPMLKSLLLSTDTVNTFSQIGLSSSIVAAAIERDMQKDKDDRELFNEFSSLLDRWPDLKNIYSLSGTSDSNEIMNKLSDRAVVDSLVNVLDEIHDNKIINPSGGTFTENENLYSMLSFIFDMTRDVGLEVDRDVFDTVETPTHSWHDEFNAIGDILYFIASHNLLNASSAFENGLTRAAINSLKNNGPNDYYIPGLFIEVNDSTIFSKALGPFLDNMFGDALSGFLIDEQSHVSFSNVTDWAVEGQNISGLLQSLYNITPEDDSQAQSFLENFDLSSFDKIVDLNAMLHDLAHSGIFTYVDNSGSHYQFGKWLYNKIETSLGAFEVESTSYDLLADPKFSADSIDEWKASWGVRPNDVGTPEPEFVEWGNQYNPNGSNPETHYLAYRDFVHDYSQEMGGDLASFWCDYDGFTTAQNAFLTAHSNDLTSTYLTNDWGAYFASDDFVNDYSPVFEVDEISRITKFLCYSLMLSTPKTDNTTLSFEDMPSSLLENLLESINDTHCMRMTIYNFYRIAAESVFDSYAAFSLSSAYSTYMIDADRTSIFDFANAAPLRSAEFDKLVSFFDFINYANNNGFIDGSNFKFDMMNDYDTNPNGFMHKFENALIALDDSFVFHKKGSSKQEQLTVFQGIFNYLLGETDTKDLLYLGNKSPKDNNATAYDSATSKVRYLITSIFLDDAGIYTLVGANNNTGYLAQRERQTDEISGLINAVNKMYSLTDNAGNVVTSIGDADLSYGVYGAANRETIYDLLRDLNDGELLRDLVPNTVYNLFIDNSAFSISAGSSPVDFSCVDPFYHYYYDTSTLTKRLDYNAKYANSDIAGIYNLLGDYQSFSHIVGEGSMTNKSTLLDLIGTDSGNYVGGGALPSLLEHMHDCHIFHTPARNYGTGYYTNIFETGYTLFEEMMDKVCTSVGLDTFAYDSTYDTASSAAEKLYNNIKGLTAIDDNGTLSDAGYHCTQGTAWHEEIDAIMRIAYSACNISSTAELDVSSFEMDKLAPAKVKEMLTAVNYSDLLCDAIPTFVKSGFDTMGLDDLTTYDTVTYSYYRLGQKVYGGLDGTSPTGSEIDNIYRVMLALYDEPHSAYYSDLDNITDFVNGPAGQDGLDGLMRFIYKSHIFNTSLNGVYDAYNVLTSGHKITAQGILLFNSMGEDLTAYIARRANDPAASPVVKTDLDKIATLSKLIHMEHTDLTGDQEAYLIESHGLKRLIDAVGSSIEANTFDAGDIATVQAKENDILAIVESAYNALGVPLEQETNYRRSVIVSEFVSGLFNTILENEYANIASAYPTYQFVVFSFGNDDADSLTFSSYSKLDKVERDGLKGIIDSLQYLNAGEPLVIAANLKLHLTEIRECFTLMGSEPGKNSEIARAIYLSEVHQLFKDMANYEIIPGIKALRDGGGNPFVPVDETSVDPNQTSPKYNIYSNGFSFDWYGDYIYSFFNSVIVPTP